MSFLKELSLLTKDRQALKTLYFLALTLFTVLCMFYWVTATGSLALRAFTFLTLFDLANLITSLLSRWAEKSTPSLTFSYGFHRVEVMSVFTATLLTQFISFFIIKEAVHHMLEGGEVETDSLLLATAFGFSVHVLVTYFVPCPAYKQLAQASPSNWVQDTVSDLGSSLFGYIPLLARIFLPGRPLNPLALVTGLSALGVAATHYLVTAHELHGADPAIAMLISFITIATLLPMTIYTSKVLLQTTPSHLLSSLDKCLREASTLDGVLEFRNEHFWTLTWGVLAGSLDVRVRRDANEQTVLAEVTHRLSQHVAILNVQVCKEETTPLFTQPSLPQTRPQRPYPVLTKPVNIDYTIPLPRARSDRNVL